MFKRQVRFAVYLIGATLFFSANAGSFEDFFVAVKNDNIGKLGELLQRGFDPNTRDEKGTSGLALAIQQNSPKAVKLLLAQAGIDVQVANQAGETALMMAAIKGDAASAQTLLDRGAKVNQSGWAPLHYAAAGPEARLVRLLLERAADIDAASPNGSTPLMMASQYGSEESVKLLLDKGADRARRNELGLSAADFARRAGRESLAKSLDVAPR